MKDQSNHLNKLNKKVMRSKTLEKEAPLDWDQHLHTMSPLQDKKQKKSQLSHQRNSRFPVHTTLEERNKIHERSGPVRNMKQLGPIPKNTGQKFP